MTTEESKQGEVVSDEKEQLNNGNIDEINFEIATDKTTPLNGEGIFTPIPMCIPGLECLLDDGQVVMHVNNLRRSEVIAPTANARMEIINVSRQVMLHVEQDVNDATTSSKSFMFHVYNAQKQEVLQVYNPASKTCLCLGASWHWWRRFCHLQSVVMVPPGKVIGFVRRAHTSFVQEFQILNAQEELLLRIRGAPKNLEIYSPDLAHELGRVCVHGWMGIMHEVRRSENDWGLTFPIDLDIRVKAVLVGALLTVNWLYT